ncbi:MAG: hypothetical protein SFV51_20605 [Bryobacteraceae bacterium]|nr:hypothetical protein [Bryobacteraceae bacterium]
MGMFLLTSFLPAQQTPPPAAALPKPEAQAQERAGERTQLNLLGQTDTTKGESRRNENVQFNLIDTNTVRELNIRLGATATIFNEFRAGEGYFGGEYGNRPVPVLHLPPAPKLSSAHGNLWFAHNNSILSARSFFQVGAVQPARENDYGFQFGSKLGRRHFFSADGRQQKLRGQVNGNVLVPLASERTPLAADPAIRAIVSRYLSVYPNELPNRPDIDPRALNTNAPQRINTNSATGRWDSELDTRSRLGFSYAFTNQQVDSFQFVAGQNPDTDTHSHTAKLTLSHTYSPSTTALFSAGFDRVTTLIRPEPNAVGPTVSISNFIAGLGPPPPIPIIRAQNKFRYGAQLAQLRGNHNWTFGGQIIRAQVNGKEQDGERGILTFANDFGRDAVTNFRMGTGSLFTLALGSTHRGFRAWYPLLYAGDKWQLSPNITLDYGIRYEASTRPVEVNGLDRIPFPCDCNNLAPRAGFAWRLPPRWGRIRAAYGLHYGEIFATTYGQTRMSPPASYRLVVGQPDIRNPFGDLRADNIPPGLLSGEFLISPDMVTPYSHQYNISWEPELRGEWRVQLAYVGSRAMKLFQMWFENRAQPVAGVPQISATINQRRPDPTKLEVFRLLNASRGYYDAARASLIVPRKARFSGEVSYWFGKAIDLGNDYTATLSGVDARQGRSQAEDGVHADLRGRSSFDQKHSFLLRGAYDLPGGFALSGVLLLKDGTPFSVETGSDAPGFGNVDGQGSDRPDLVDPAVLGRSLGNPDTSTSLLPRSAFRYIQATQARGNLGRNTFRRGRIANVNSAITRNWRLAGERALEFRAESINFLNTPQFSEPVKELTSPSFARITNTLNDGRTFRFLLRFRF